MLSDKQKALQQYAMFRRIVGDLDVLIGAVQSFDKSEKQCDVVFGDAMYYFKELTVLKSVLLERLGQIEANEYIRSQANKGVGGHDAV